MCGSFLPSSSRAPLTSGELASVEVTEVAGFGRRAGGNGFGDLEQSDDSRRSRLQVGGRFGGYFDERDARVIGPAVALASFVSEPCPPVRLVKLADHRAIFGDDGAA